jgi:hypothetical protein
MRSTASLQQLKLVTTKCQHVSRAQKVLQQGPLLHYYAMISLQILVHFAQYLDYSCISKQTTAFNTTFQQTGRKIACIALIILMKWQLRPLTTEWSCPTCQ